MTKVGKQTLILKKLRHDISSGRWQGTVMPREVDLAAELGVARDTLRKAFSVLEGEGVLVRRKRLGTFVRNSSSKPVTGVIMRCRDDFFQGHLPQSGKRNNQSGMRRCVH